MSDLWCQTCGGFRFTSDQHHCPPVWEYWIEDYQGEPGTDDGDHVYAIDGESAAEKAIEHWDSRGDYTCIGGEDVKVTVRGKDGKFQRFEVHGESVPQYRAREIKEDTNGGLRKSETKPSGAEGQPSSH